MRRLIEDFWRREHIKRGYDVIFTPHIAKVDMWKTSGHWSFYRENMYSPMDVDGQDYVIKPMNCVSRQNIYLIYKPDILYFTSEDIKELKKALQDEFIKEEYKKKKASLHSDYDELK